MGVWFVVDDHPARLRRAELSLRGLTIGDALGKHIGFANDFSGVLAESLTWPPGPWSYTDDSVMAWCLVEELRARGGSLSADSLALRYAEAYRLDPERGYGAVAYWLLFQLAEGGDWRELSPSLFQGQGSLGNGAAMRVAPVGAYFANEVLALREQARISAEVTHAHPEGQAGALAVAAAAALAVTEPQLSGSEWLGRIRAFVPDGGVAEGIERAMDGVAWSLPEAAQELGLGQLIRAQDTVPLALWILARAAGQAEAAMTEMMRACLLDHDSDRDTLGAIVGGVAVLWAGLEGFPRIWDERAERVGIETLGA